MQGGIKVYRGSAAAARNYVEADRSRVDDYYLAEGSGLAERYVAWNDGLVGDKCVICTWHGWRFSLEDGRFVDSKKTRVATYPVRVVDDQIQVGV